MRLGKNQGLDAAVQQGGVLTAAPQSDASTMVQQGDASTIVNVPSTDVPDGGNSGTNRTQEHGVMDPDASLLSELGSRTPRFGTCTRNEFSSIKDQVASPTQGVVPSEANPSAPPRLDTSNST